MCLFYQLWIFLFIFTIKRRQRANRLPLRCFTAEPIITSAAQTRRQRSCQPWFFSAADITANSRWTQQRSVLNFFVCFVANHSRDLSLWNTSQADAKDSSRWTLTLFVIYSGQMTHKFWRSCQAQTGHPRLRFWLGVNYDVLYLNYLVFINLTFTFWWNMFFNGVPVILVYVFFPP